MRITGVQLTDCLRTKSLMILCEEFCYELLIFEKPKNFRELAVCGIKNFRGGNFLLGSSRCILLAQLVEQLFSTKTERYWFDSNIGYQKYNFLFSLSYLGRNKVFYILQFEIHIKKLKK